VRPPSQLLWLLTVKLTALEFVNSGAAWLLQGDCAFFTRFTPKSYSYHSALVNMRTSLTNHSDYSNDRSYLALAKFVYKC